MNVDRDIAAVVVGTQEGPSYRISVCAIYLYITLYLPICRSGDDSLSHLSRNAISIFSLFFRGWHYSVFMSLETTTVFCVIHTYILTYCICIDTT